MRFIRRAGSHADKSSKRLHVEPAELARKLVKEMEDHKVSRSNRVWVRNHYTIYLCPEDYEALMAREAEIKAELLKKLARHAEDMKYVLYGELGVEVVLDPELELGYFGILAQRVYPSLDATAATEESPVASGEVPAPAAPAQAAPVATQAEPVAAEAAPVVAQAAPLAAAVGGPPPGIVPAGAMAGAAVAGAAVEAVVTAPELKIPAATEVIAAQQAEELGLAHKVIVVTSGHEVQEFTQSRVVLGRGREADFRVEDPNVSRKHAAIYWSDGLLMLEDLGSTNGTMVNGYPVTTTILRPRDVVIMGESRITVDSK